MRPPRRAVVLLLAVVLVGWLGINLYGAWTIAYDAKPRILAQDPSTYDLAFTQERTSLGLRTWIVPAAGSAKPALVLVHGHGDQRAGMLGFARAFHDAGFPVLIPELGVDVGKAYGGGQREVREIAATVALAHRQGMPDVALVGYSQGGYEVLLAAAHRLPVRAVVSDAGFTSIVVQAEDRGAPGFVVGLMPVVYPLLSHGGHLQDAGHVLGLGKGCVPPVMVIQGLADTAVHPHNGTDAARLFNAPLWKLPGVKHVGAFDHDPAYYVSRVGQFITEAKGCS